MCIWEWKRDIFLTNNPGLEDQFSELSLPSVKERIQRWLDSKGGCPAGSSDEEYSFYIKSCFPITDNRRAYFQEKVRSAKPHVGYHLLCFLAEAEIIHSVWTTNFDGLTPRAAANFTITPIEVGIDCQERLPRQPKKGDLLCVSLHGDYRYDPLKNTKEELQQQEAQLRQALIETTRDTSLIVIGYSGRDQSIMEALTTAYSQYGAAPLYWCGFGHEIPPSIQLLIETARANGRTAFFVPTDGFDDVMSRLARHCLSPTQREKVITILAQATEAAKAQRTPFTIEDAPVAAIIKSNAFEVECPSEVFAFDLKEWPKEKVWAWIKEKAKGHNILAVPFRKVLAFGILDNIKDAFADNIAGTIERVPIGDDDTRHEDGAVVCLLRRALITAIAAKFSLETDGDDSLWEKEKFDTKLIDGRKLDIHRMVILYLRRIAGRMYAILKPSLYVRDPQGAKVPREMVNALKLSLLGWQHNKEFNQEIQHWRRLLFENATQTIFQYPAACASPFRFKVRRAPVFAKIGDKSRSQSLRIDDDFRPLLQQSGLILPEPNLRFLSADATRYVTDQHPLRGLVNNRPFDFVLTQKGLAQRITLGVICPKAETRFLETYLHRSTARLQPQANEEDYLLPYPGFSQAFRVPLDIPQTGSTGWESCPEPDASLDDKAGTLESSRLLTKAIDSLNSTHKPDVVLIFVPERWRRFRRFETEDEVFDLHDFVKAYCVQKGVPTQFLDQDTLDHKQQCRIWWWLSLALYAKAMRTPWVLDSLSSDTAFVGLGFSINRKAPKGEHIILGCSHLYNAQGQGLQYRLSKIENARIINDNPFMSRDDACRVGETIRQLFFDAQRKLPRRVVIHKLTPFRRDEREGLREGLGGVDEVDMLEINLDDALRYVSSVPRRGGGFDEDNFPVRRGTVVKLEDFTALLWVHGATDAVRQGWKYFQGKRRIPAPVVLRRYAGRSDLSLLAEELLGLSKMDWNSGDLYSKLPATVSSSKQISQLGMLLQRFGPMSYDYRLFI
jgi:SIR2-like domain